MNKKEINMLREEKRIAVQNISRKDELKAACDHVKPNNKTALENKNGNNQHKVKCSICNAKINLEPKTISEIESMAEELINAVQCIKVAYKGNDKEAFKELGSLIIALKKLPSWYSNIFLKDFEEINEKSNNNFERNFGVNGSMSITTNSNMFGFNSFNNNTKKKNKKNKKKNKNKWY